MARKTASKAANGIGNLRKKTVTRGGKTYTYWEGRVTVGTDPGTGKPIRRSFTGKTQKEVRERMQAAAVEVNTGDYFEPSKMLLSRWVEIWLEEYMGDKKYSTVKHYKATCRNHIVPKLGAVKLQELSTPQIQKFYNDLQRDGLAPKTVHNIHVILSKCLSTAAQVDFLRDNPASRATLPRIKQKEIHPLTDEQVKKFLEIAGEDEYEIILKVILLTGLRESEALGLTWDVIDFQKGTVKVCKQLQRRTVEDGGYTFDTPKNGKTRTIKPSPTVMNLLARRKKEQTEQRLKAGPAWVGWQNEAERKTALVFTMANGKNITPKSLYIHYKNLAARIDAPDSRVHDLRHTFAVLSLQNGDDVKTVQHNLGHSSAAFTLDVYGHCSEKMKDDSAARMENYLQALKKF